jgi:hypothetical protein
MSGQTVNDRAKSAAYDKAEEVLQRAAVYAYNNDNTLNPDEARILAAATGDEKIIMTNFVERNREGNTQGKICLLLIKEFGIEHNEARNFLNSINFKV